MKLKEAISTLQFGRKNDARRPMYTPFGEKLDPSAPLPEHPNPYLCRENWQSLNGWADYAIKDTPAFPDTWDGRILVPFSPEALLSGVNRQLLPDQYLMYRIRFTCLPPAENEAILLHFGAVDEACDVYVDGTFIGSHRGGYLSFTCDITEALRGGKKARRSSSGVTVSASNNTASDSAASDNAVSDNAASDNAASDNSASDNAAAYNSHTLLLRVTDTSDTSFRSRGKQSLHPKGMFYTAQSGIWQSVWLERVPKNHITDLRITPDIESGSFIIRVRTSAPCRVRITIGCPDRFDADFTGQPGRWQKDASDDTYQNEGDRTVPLPSPQNGISRTTPLPAPTIPTKIPEDLILDHYEGTSGTAIICPLPEISLWSPEEPCLYPIVIETDSGDRVSSFAGLRSFSRGVDENGTPRLFLNGKPYFHHGVLDQGYWSDGLYTAPSEDAFIFDIISMKRLGFNMLRKHIKIEAMRWYYHCDRLGMLVWQDLVNGGSRSIKTFLLYLPTILPFVTTRFRDDLPAMYPLFSRISAEGRALFEHEMKATLRQLMNVTSISLWTAFNEGWGQFDANRIAEELHRLDPTRLVDHASGWYDQGGGDIVSQHNYFRKLIVKKGDPRPFCFSEYGGLSLHIAGHTSSDEVFAYDRFEGPEDLKTAFAEKMAEIRSLEQDGLAGAVYTQVSDVEEEVNGILTFDRRVNKME